MIREYNVLSVFRLYGMIDIGGVYVGVVAEKIFCLKNGFVYLIFIFGLYFDLDVNFYCSVF